MRGRQIFMLVLMLFMTLALAELSSAAICNIRLKLYDPENTLVLEKICQYDNTTTANTTCNAGYYKCFVTGTYYVEINDTQPGCSGIFKRMDYYMCDASMPNIKGYSPSYFSATADNANNAVNASWNVFDTGLLLYYAFESDNSTHAKDWCPLGNNGKVYGALDYIDGRMGNGRAARFDGNDYLNVSGNLGNPSGMTIAFWFNKSNLDAGAQYFMDARNGGNWWLLQDYVSGACTDSSGNICMDGRAEINTSHLKQSGVWWHVAIVQNATKTIMYLNGVNVSSGNGEAPQIGNNLIIGARYTTTYKFNGLIDELRIYNRTLSRNEIVDLYLSGLISHGLYRASTGLSTYKPSFGHFDEFSSNLNDYLEGGSTKSVDWKIVSNMLVAEVNESAANRNYSYLNHKYLDVSGKDILVEYDVKYNEKANESGVRYRGINLIIGTKINSTYWWDNDRLKKFRGVSNNTWHHVKLYIYGNRTGPPITSLYVNHEWFFYEEPINVSSFGDTKIGLVGPKNNDTVQFDNFEVTLLTKDIKAKDTNATDINPPNPFATAPAVQSNQIGSITVSWNSVSDAGSSYYFYVQGLDFQDNPSNMIRNSHFESGSYSPWQAYGAGTTISTKSGISKFGNYSLYVNSTGTGKGVKYTLSDFSAYKGKGIYFECHARAKSGSLNVTIGLNNATAPYNYTLTTDWSLIKYAGTLNSAATEFTAYIKTANGLGEFYIDECVMQAVLSATVTLGLHNTPYYVNETSENTGGDDSNWISGTSYIDSGLNCFKSYTYKVRARDKVNNIGSYSASNSTYPIPSGTCTYGSPSLGYCFDTANDLCYISSEGCEPILCLTPGYILGTSCYYHSTTTREDDCDVEGCNVQYEDHGLECSAGGFSESGANCWVGTSCYFNGTNPCSPKTGWEYATDTVLCSAGNSVCCPIAGRIAEGANCTKFGATGNLYYRNTSQARCESSQGGCTPYTWSTLANNCCGAGLPDFCEPGFEKGACVGGIWHENHCTDGVKNCGEKITDSGGPWCPIWPVVNSAILNSSLGKNRSNENLSVYYNLSDENYDELFDVVDWRIDGSSIAVLNMPFQLNHGSNNITKDFTTFGNNGTVYGATWTRHGLIGGAYVFDGVNDYINISHDSSLSFAYGKPFSILLWFKTFEPEDTSQFILAKGAGVTSYNYKIELASSGIQFIISNSTAQQSVSSGFTPSKNVWYMVAMTYNGSRMNAYINGSYIGTKNINGVITNSNPLMIGRYMGAGDYHFNGSIDEVRIFNRSLSAEQIKRIYEEEYNQRHKLVLNMHFGVNVSSLETGAITDFSPFQNNGTLGGGYSQNAPVWNSSGKIGGVYVFDGLGDYISVPDSNSLDLTDSITIAAWVRDPPIDLSAPSISEETLLPRVIRANVSPPKVRVGERMEITAEVEDRVGLSDVSVKMPFEGGSDILPLNLTNGTVWSGIWRGTWLVHDTREKQYTSLLTATNALGLSTTKELFWWDPVCVLKSSCSADEVCIFSVYQENDTHIAACGYFDYNVCCGGGVGQTYFRTGSCNSGELEVLRVEWQNDTHVENPDQKNYGMILCGKNWASCDIKGSCNERETCLLSLYDTTDSHIGACDYYTHKLCCEFSYKVTQLPLGLSIVLTSNESFNLTKDGTTGLKNVLIKKGAVKIANFTIDFIQNINFSDLIADTDGVNAKALIYVNRTKHTYVAEDFTLRVPVVSGSGAVYVCPQALALNEINQTCPNIYWLTGMPNQGGYYYVPVKGTGAGEGKGPEKKGIIEKQGAYALYLNASGTRVYGQINGKNVSAQLSNPTSWHHIVMTYNGTKIKLFVDGQESVSAAYGDAISTNSNPIMIGKFFSGDIDEVKIFNASLSFSEIQKLYWEGINKRRRGLTSQELFAEKNFSACVWASDNTFISAIRCSNWLKVIQACPTIQGNVFIVQNSTGINCMIVDESGDTAIRGLIGEMCTKQPGPKDFVVRTADAVVMWVNHSNCNMCLLGKYYQLQSSISPGTNEFLVKNNTAYLLKIDSAGNLYARGVVSWGCNI